MNRSAGVAATPYQGYTGQEIAPVNAQQQAGIGNINAIGGPNSPFVNQITQSSQPLTAQQIQQYQSPYTQDVVNATQAEFNNQNQQQQSQVQGNAAAQGALGGDRSGVAAALTAGQENLAQAPVIAGLENQGYTQGVQTAEQQQQIGLQGGVAGQQAAMQGAQAQVGAGTLEQQTTQAQNTQAMQDYYQQQGYPFQVAQWLAGIQTGVGSQMGGTSAGATTGPAPNPWAQVAGGALAAGAILSDARAKENIEKVGKLHDGQTIYRFNYKGDKTTHIGLMHDEVEKKHPEAAHRISGIGAVDYHKATEDAVRKALGGRIAGFAGGGAPTNPWTGAHTWVPVAPIHGGSGAPHPSAPAMQKPIGGLTADQMKGVGAISTKAQNSPAAEHLSDYQEDVKTGDAAPLGDYLSLPSWRGGRISGFADGGSPWGGAESWVPTDNITAGSGAPKATAPSLPSQTATSGLGSLLNGTQLKGLSNLGTAFSNSSAGDAASDFMQDLGEWRGGRIKRYATGGFADGGDPTFDDRFSAAYPNVTAGIGASAPAYDAVNPDQAYRMDPIADDRWRARVDRDNGRNIREVAQDQGEPAPVPIMAQGDDNVTAGVSAIRKAANLQDNDTGLPEGTSAYQPPSRGLGTPQAAPAPQEAPPEEGGLLSSLGIKMTPELRQGLLQAGLSMMATTRGGPGSFLGAAGEAGMAGVGAYNKSLQLTQEAEDKARKEAFEREKFERPYQQPTAEQAWQHEHKGEMTDYQQAEVKRQAIDQAIKLKTPIQIGQSITGSPIMALPRIDPKGNVALYPIDGQGNVATTPIEPGSKIKPAPATVASEAESWKPDPKALPGQTGSRNEAYLEQIRQEDLGQADAIKKAANYELDPAKYASMRRDQRQHFIDRVLRYDPNYTPQDVGLKYQAQRAFLPGTKNGDTITAFNTAISHLDTLKDMYHALNNGDIQTINRIKNTFQQEFGRPAPNDVAALASIIGGEVVKATVGAQNALGDREEVRASISRDLGKMQADSVIDKYQKLMGGQLNARKFAYEQSTGLHNFEEHFLQPRSQEVLKRVTADDTTGGGGNVIRKQFKQGWGISKDGGKTWTPE